MAACHFDASGATSDRPDAAPGDAGDAGLQVPDGPTGSDAIVYPGLPGVMHVPPAGSWGGVGDLTLSGTVTINTSGDQPSITPAPSVQGVVFDVSRQDCAPTAPACPDLALLHTRSFVVAAGANVTVVGTRPLVILAAGDVHVDGLLDGGGKGAQPGAGGAGSAAGLGAGQPGVHSGIYSDSGGGGGGFGSAGADGGNVTGGPGGPANGGRGGPMYGDAMQMVLLGGSGGAPGSAGSCGNNPGGAGGGAIQLYSATAIHVGAGGAVNTGGGGGAGGIDCGAAGNAGGGAGGGSGGAIFLQAPVVDNAGRLTANGAGGGGGGGGQPGQDGVSALGATAALGGPPGTFSGGGGNGGAGNLMPTKGYSVDLAAGGNGGGAGGAFGRVRVITRAPASNFTNSGTISPNQTVGMY